MLRHIYDDIISVENLLISWREFLRGKRKRKDVAEFSVNFFDNIFLLQQELVAKTYRHGDYQAFKINDPKPRDIHKASVRDRLVHHAIYRILYPYFERKFIFDSYSCRIGKGTHRAINRFRDFGRKVSKNNTRTCWILKCDIKKFFASINHDILKRILAGHIGDEDALWLLGQVVDSFGYENYNPGSRVKHGMTSGMGRDDRAGQIGLPLGNLTSQLLVNIYMNEFDHFVKRELKVRYYIRYADDFVIFSENKNNLEKLVQKIAEFLEAKLKLSLHPDKVFIKTWVAGVDFLGWVNFPQHRVLRTATKRRMLKRLKKKYTPETSASYLGLLLYGNAHKLFEKIKKQRFHRPI